MRGSGELLEEPSEFDPHIYEFQPHHVNGVDGP